MALIRGSTAAPKDRRRRFRGSLENKEKGELRRELREKYKLKLKINKDFYN